MWTANEAEGFWKSVVLERDNTIKQLKTEIQQCEAKLEYEQYIYSEEQEWSNDVIQLLIQCKPIIEGLDGELHEKIKQVINAISV